MSVLAASLTAWQQYARVLRHFWLTRGVEVCLLQASPLLGRVSAASACKEAT